jgi:predicted Na+-dependent transporter
VLIRSGDTWIHLHRIAIVFGGSKMSLAAGEPMAGVLFPGPDLGMILLPTMHLL